MKRILVCEDEIDSRESIRHTLEKRGYEVFGAQDGEQSIQQARELKPDLILLDIRMPKIDGIEVAKEVRKFDTESKIIFVTAFQGKELHAEASRYNISCYITKPSSAEQILEAIKAALDS